MLFHLDRAGWPRLREETRTLSHLALPMMVAQIAQVATGFVDTVMAGRVSTDDLAAVSLGASIFVTAYVTLMGVVSALNPILSHQFGAGETRGIGETARQGLWFGLLLGCLGALLMLAIQPLLRQWLSLPDTVEDKVMLYIDGAAFGMPAAMMHRALHAFASSLNRPRPIMVVSLIALLLNIPLNYMLIHGLFGLPQLGGAGCGWATGVVMWFNAITLFVYLARNRALAGYGLTQQFSWPQWSRFPAMLRLGLPIGLSFFVEVSLFSFIALLIAQLGTLVVASHQAVLNFSSLIYMIPQSIATALTIRVGQSIGSGDYQQARLISGLGIALSIAAALLTMLLVLLFRHQIIAMYSQDPAVVALGSTLMLFAAFYQLTDAMQTVASGALRGYKITTLPMVIHIVSFWGLGLGLGMVLGLTDWLLPRLGVHGFWAALVVSLSVAGLTLVGYLSHISRQRLHRQTL
ncbi:MATE family efflux transporter [Vogesella alkaliphila]|uniref:Multidrug-efflux transporter n=1 Tax=Vogesella alkaliphila TaxID=1193621 RepID=A0ABQ2YEU7_9NEIS|nr:MATE family efflux transporter [Vogesella alkaliphila]GGX79871.1 putative multidrug resistance protein NorM [Vogesella alkaliphila]